MKKDNKPRSDSSSDEMIRAERIERRDPRRDKLLGKTTKEKESEATKVTSEL